MNKFCCTFGIAMICLLYNKHKYIHKSSIYNLLELYMLVSIIKYIKYNKFIIILSYCNSSDIEL